MNLTPTMLKILRLCASGTTRYYHPSINGRGMVNCLTQKREACA